MALLLTTIGKSSTEVKGQLIMPALNPHASVEIAASANAVRKVLVDFHAWPTWSPWLYLQPDAQMSFRGEAGVEGHGHEWAGEKIGAGSMTLGAVTDQQVDCELQFLKPFKSSASVRFELQNISADKTRVSWHMDSRLPFFLSFMTGTMNGMIRADFRRGLAMLKDFLESGAVHSRSEVAGVVQLEAANYVGYTSKAAIATISESMKSSFVHLYEGAHEGTYVNEGLPMSFLEKMNYKRDECTFTAAIPVADVVTVEAPMVSATRPACTALKVVHTGPYHHLGNAWAMLMSDARHRKLKILKSISPFEVYLNDAKTTSPEKLITELYLPLRG